MNLCEQAIASTFAGELAYCKFLSANDTGENGSHQAGIYIAKSAVPILFNEPGMRGSNKDRMVRIIRPEGLATDSRFIMDREPVTNIE